MRLAGIDVEVGGALAPPPPWVTYICWIMQLAPPPCKRDYGPYPGYLGMLVFGANLDMAPAPSSGGIAGHTRDFRDVCTGGVCDKVPAPLFGAIIALFKQLLFDPQSISVSVLSRRWKPYPPNSKYFGASAVHCGCCHCLMDVASILILDMFFNTSLGSSIVAIQPHLDD